MSRILTDDDRITLERELQVLEQEHQDLDASIHALIQIAMQDQLQMQRLKRKKLALKDKIVAVRGLLRPDIIA
ncbi:MAG: YdcH family protein [Beijerinckiaceae bacterium]